MKLLTAILFLVACGHHDAAKPCTSATSHLELVRVDDGSTYMKSVYAHVGSDRSGTPSEPGAIAAGITAAIDSWQEMETKAGMELPGDRHTDYYLQGADRDALEKYIATLAPPPNDRKLVLERVLPLPDSKERRTMWRTYYVMTTKLIDDTAIESATANEPDGKRVSGPSVNIKLTPTGQAAFAQATANNAGHKLATIVDGVVISAPIVDGAIKGGSFMITMPSTPDATDLLKRLGC